MLNVNFSMNWDVSRILTPQLLLLILEGNSAKGASAWSEIGSLIYLRHLSWLKAAHNLNFFLKRPVLLHACSDLPSNLSTMPQFSQCVSISIGFRIHDFKLNHNIGICSVDKFNQIQLSSFFRQNFPFHLNENLVNYWNISVQAETLTYFKRKQLLAIHNFILWSFNFLSLIFH